ncbi:MAG: hypothetical protein LBB34_01275 [Holosporales bacterium]|nr:hypothetical protein [Holosporales bacterium]
MKLFVSFDVEQMIAMTHQDGISSDNPGRLYRNVLHEWTFEREFNDTDWVLSKTSSVER